MSTVQKLTDHIVLEMSKRDASIDGYKLFSVLKEIIIETEARYEVDLAFWESLPEKHCKGMDEDAKHSISRGVVQLIHKHLGDDIKIENREQSSVSGPYRIREYSYSFPVLKLK